MICCLKGKATGRMEYACHKLHFLCYLMGCLSGKVIFRYPLRWRL